MSGAILSLPQYAFMAGCLVKAQGQLYLYLFAFTSYFSISVAEAANILNKQSQTADKGWSSTLALGEGLAALRRIKPACYEMLGRASESDGIGTGGRLL
jgi:hypothetical protein